MYRTKTAAERVSKWDRRYTGDHVKSVIDTDKPIMLENASAAVTDLVKFDGATRQVLNGEGVSVMDVVDYLTFSRQLWKLKNHYAGETLSIETQSVLSKWTSRGLIASVLEKIRNDVYTIPAPTGP